MRRVSTLPPELFTCITRFSLIKLSFVIVHRIIVSFTHQHKQIVQFVQFVVLSCPQHVDFSAQSCSKVLTLLANSYRSLSSKSHSFSFLFNLSVSISCPFSLIFSQFATWCWSSIADWHNLHIRSEYDDF